MDVESEFYGLIFCRTKRDVDLINDRLMSRGYDSEAMHGDLSQHQRERVLKKFRKKQCNILVVTDVASRGLDISGLSHVVNYALPQDPESYVHRVGRTGRAGQSGTAITLITPSEYRKLLRIQKVAKTDIKKGTIPKVDAIISAKRQRIKDSIVQAMSGESEAAFVDFAEEILADSNPKEALAGVLKIAFEDELSESEYSDIQPAGKRSRDRKDRGDRSERGSRRDGRKGKRSSDGFDRGAFLDEKGQTRLFVAVGRRDKMNPRKLVDIIQSKTNIKGRHIDGVEILDNFSFINVPYQYADKIIKAFKDDGRNNKGLVTRAK